MNQVMQTENPPSAHPRRSWTAAGWAAAVAASAFALLLPAIYNGLPLIFPDTSAYLGVSYGNRWTVDRSAFYGLFLKPLLLPTDSVTGLWLAIALQCAIIAIVLLFAVRRLLPNAAPGAALAVVLATAAATSLPWHSAQLMPDAVAGILVLLTWLAASRDLARRGSPLLWLAVAAAALLHYTYLALVLVAAAASLLVCAGAGVQAREIGKRALAACLVGAAVIAAQVTVHGVYLGRWTVAPQGPYFLFARLYEDGLVPRWLDRHCGRDAPQPLCDLKGSIPQDSQEILWSETSPFYSRIHQKLGQPEARAWVDMMEQAAMGSIREEPIAFAGSAARATVSQFVHFGALDDECPERCKGALPFDLRSDLARPLHDSRQLRGTLAEGPVRLVTSAVAILGLLLLIPFLIVAWRRKDALAQGLLVTIIGCLFANAAMAGALSDVHDRYQSRLVWLAPFAALVLFVRWRRPGDGRSLRRAEITS